MPSRSPRACPKCGKPTQARYCDAHAGEATRQERARDREAGPRLYDLQRWKRFRKWFLSQPEHRICACGCGRLSTEVDHIIPISGPDDPLCWSMSNLQGLCKESHSRKTMTEMRATRGVPP